MSACICCCSIIRPSPLSHDPNYPWSPPPSNSNPYRPNCPLTLRNDSNYHHHNLNISSSSSSRLIARSLQQQGLGVGVDSTDNSLALKRPVIDEEVQVQVEVEEEEVHGPVINGVAETKSQTPSATKTKKKKEEDDDDSFENRFKLRNGREVRFF